MEGPRSRRDALRFGGLALLPFVAGCSQTESADSSPGGTDTATRTPPDIDAYDIRIENKTTSNHKVQVLVQSEFGEETYFDEQIVVDSGATKAYENAVSNEEEQVVVAHLDKAVEGKNMGPRDDEYLNDTIRITPGSSSAPADPTVRVLVRKVEAKYEDEKQKIVDVTYAGRPTETEF